MIRVMLVDDDHFFRSMFSNLIDWNSYGCELTCQAENGQQAIDLLNQRQIDLVFTDMSMPIVDGVQLIDYISRYMPHIRYVALSSYDDFAYVKESLTHGAIDYVLKHMLTKQDLERVIDNFKKVRSASYSVSPDSTEVTMQLRSDFLEGLLRGTYASADDLSALLKAASLPDIRRNILLFSLEIPDYRDLIDKYIRLNKLTQWTQTILSIMQSILDKLGDGVVFYSEMDRHIYTLLSSASFNDIDFAENTASLFMKQVRNSLKTYLNIQCELTTAPLCRDIRDIHHSYGHLLKQLGQPLPDTSLRQNQTVALPAYFTYIIKHRLFMDNIDTLRGTIISLFDEARGKKCSRPQFVELTFDLYKLYILLSNQIMNTGAVLTEMETTQIYSLKNDSRMQSYILGAFEGLCERIRGKNKNRYSQIVYSAIYDIHKRCDDSTLTLNTIADNIHVNPSYLSRIFKNENTVGIMDYINIYRVAHAVDLLLTTPLTVKIIAQRCGFDNYNYFFKVFRKYTEMTPNEFRLDNNVNILNTLDSILYH